MLEVLSRRQGFLRRPPAMRGDGRDVAPGRPLWSRSGIILAYDSLVAGLCVYAAISLRLGELVFPARFSVWPHGFAVALAAIFGLVSYASGNHRAMWRHSSSAELFGIIRLTALSLLVTYGPLLLLYPPSVVPRSMPLIQFFLMVCLLGGSRLLYRTLLHGRRARRSTPAAGKVPENTLLIGGTEGAATFLHTLKASPKPSYAVVGIVARDRGEVGRRVQGVPVVAATDDLESAFRRFDRAGPRLDRVVLTEAVRPARIERLVELCRVRGIELCRTPSPLELHSAPDADPVAVRPIALRDLLGRREIRLDQAPVAALIRQRRIAVTGAAGSIGSELVRQIAQQQPARLLLIDNNECNLFFLEREIQDKFPQLTVRAALCDVRLEHPLRRLFELFRPDIVFHAAALKHVPMVELNACEGVLTNVIGTRNVVDACRAAGVPAMVQVSTDKAVNPTNVMGASKRLAELYCQAADLMPPDPTAVRPPRFFTVRFGNVLGSSGSVIPVFRQQIARGGPVTVTDPRITRYFMTTQEAVSLMLHASAHGIRETERGLIYVLDMGEPIRVLEIAEKLIRLAGLEPHKDIPIAYVGLRPGEKLYEELFDAGETRLRSGAEGILAARSPGRDLGELRREIDQLSRLCLAYDHRALRSRLAALVPGYASAAPDLASPSNELAA